MDESNGAVERSMDPEILATLTAEHRRFLAFLERRVKSRAEAEEILQAAFVKGIERGGALREGESAVAWFYRLLRNALTDHYRRRGTEVRALERVGREQAVLGESYDVELAQTVCGCLGGLITTLKPEYAALLQAVDLEERPVAEVAEGLGITANNAGVRLHRARQALKRRLEATCGTCATHGCLDCQCETGAEAGCH